MNDEEGQEDIEDADLQQVSFGHRKRRPVQIALIVRGP